MDEWQDFSTSSPLEKLIARIESQLRSWKINGENELVPSLKDTQVEPVVLHVAGQSVQLTCHQFASTAPASTVTENNDDINSDDDDCWLPEIDEQTEAEYIRRAFGLQRFLVLKPVSAASASRTAASNSSGVSNSSNSSNTSSDIRQQPHVSLASRAVTLLSAVSTACDGCACTWPCLVPVAEPWRGAYVGYQCQSPRLVFRFESCSAGHPPPSLRQTSDIVRLHFQRHEPSLLLGLPSLADGAPVSRLHFRTTFEVETESAGDPVAFMRVTASWPCITLREPMSSQALAATLADDAFPPTEAPHWTVRPVYSADPSLPLVETLLELADAVTKSKSALSVNALVSAALKPLHAAATTTGSGSSNTARARDATTVTAAVRGGVAVAARAAVGVTKAAATKVPAVSGLVSAAGAGGSVLMDVAGIDRARVDPDSLNQFVQFAFDCDIPAPAEGSPAANASDGSLADMAGCVRRAKGAPPRSLLATLVLRVLPRVRGSLVSWAMVWRAFVAEVRRRWETRERLAARTTSLRPPTRMAVDFGTCLAHQKLQLLDYCIAVQRQREANKAALAARQTAGTEAADDSAEKSQGPPRPSSRLLAAVAVEEADIPTDGWGGDVDDDSLNLDGIASCGDDDDNDDDDDEDDASPSTRRQSTRSDEPDDGDAEGRAERLEGLHLLHRPNQPVYLPHLQDAGPFTEDMARDREAVLLNMAAAADGHESASVDAAQFQSAVLKTDMSAFKAANPGAILEDFVRWHSPRDWQDGQLSGRMTGPDNVWRITWDSAPPVPASKQQPLFDAEVEANKALDYLETMLPHELIVQILLTVVRCLPFSLASSVGGCIDWSASMTDSSLHDDQQQQDSRANKSTPVSVLPLRECASKIAVPTLTMDPVTSALQACADVLGTGAEGRAISSLNGDHDDGGGAPSPAQASATAAEAALALITPLVQAVGDAELVFRRALSLCLALGARTGSLGSARHSALAILTHGYVQDTFETPLIRRSLSLDGAMLERWRELLIQRSQYQRTYACLSDRQFQLATVQLLPDAFI